MTVLGPWVVSQSCTDLPRVGAVDEMGGVGAGADRATDDDQAISDQMIHERGMVIPAVLFADSAAVVPRRAVYEGAQKEGHGLTLGETSGKGSAGGTPAPSTLLPETVVVAVTRLLTNDDASALSELLRRNRVVLAPWQPLRSDSFFTLKGQQESVAQALVQHQAGNSVPLVIDDGTQVIGTITLQSIIRGAFQSCSVGYWLAEDAQGQGLATEALREAVHLAFHELHLHRVQAETLVHNVRSQRVLDRLDFARYGLAPAYLKIAGRWQDNLLYQLLTPALELVGLE